MEKYFLSSFRGRLFICFISVIYYQKKNLLHFCFHEKSLCFVYKACTAVSRVGGKFLGKV